MLQKEFFQNIEKKSLIQQAL